MGVKIKSCAPRLLSADRATLNVRIGKLHIVNRPVKDSPTYIGVNLNLSISMHQIKAKKNDLKGQRRHGE